MDDIEFVKWLCEKAEGFELSNSFGDPSLGLKIKYLFGDDSGIHETPEKFNVENHPIRKLLLQSAIEGVNREDGKFYIIQYTNSVIVFNDPNTSNSFMLKEKKERTFDYLKESALKYIYEQERNNNEK